MTEMTEITNCTCQTCKFSRTKEIFDPIIASQKHIFDSVPGTDPEKFFRYAETKCYLQGKPQRVNPRIDWCYKWENKCD